MALATECVTGVERARKRKEACTHEVRPLPTELQQSWDARGLHLVVQEGVEAKEDEGGERGVQPRRLHRRHGR